MTLEELIDSCTTYEVGEKDGEALIPARFKPCPESGCVGTNWDCGGGRDHRLSRNVYEMHALGLDIDDITLAQVDAITDAMQARGLTFIVWTTHSNATTCATGCCKEEDAPRHCRIRLLFPFASPMPLVNPRQWSAVAWPALVRWLGLPVGTDFSCRNPDRIYYLPRVPSEDAPRAAASVAGQLLDWKPIVGDAIAAAAQEVSVIAPAAEEDPTRPVDLDEVKRLLAKIDDPILKRVLKGEAPTAPPDRRVQGEMPRREAWKRITVHLANVVEGWESSEALLEIIRPAYRQEVAESPDDHTAWDKIVELFTGARASAPSYKAEKRAREQAWHVIARGRLRRLALPGAGDVPGPDVPGPVAEAVAEPAPAPELEILAADVPVAAPVAQPREYALTDMGNAYRFLDQHREQLRHVPAWGAWLAWDGRRWRKEDQSITTRYAFATAKSIYAEAGASTDPETARTLAKWAHATSFRRPLEAMVRLSGGLDGMRVPIDKLDADPMLFNCSNGTLDLRTGTLRPHDVGDLLTKLSPINFDPAASCPLWERFLERVVPSEGMRTFMQRAIGYSLTGHVTEQVLFFLHGSGANGKSTLLTTLQHVFGDYARQGAPDLLLSSVQHESHPTAQADLVGARLVVCSEVEHGKSFAETAVKQLTGSDQIKARYMRQDFFEFVPTHKIFLAANHKPRIRGTDHGIWRRLRLIPFDTRISESEKDPQLGDKLKAEAAGILAWCMRGCLMWQAQRLGSAEVMANATAEYRKDQDTLAHFLDEHTEQAADGNVTHSEIYAAFVRWCERTGEKPWSGRTFSNALFEREWIRPWRSATQRGFAGIRMKSMTRGAQVALSVVKSPGAA